MRSLRSLLSYGVVTALVVSFGLETPIAQAGNFPALATLTAEPTVPTAPIILADIARVAKSIQVNDRVALARAILRYEKLDNERKGLLAIAENLRTDSQNRRLAKLNEILKGEGLREAVEKAKLEVASELNQLRNVADTFEGDALDTQFASVDRRLFEQINVSDNCGKSFCP